MYIWSYDKACIICIINSGIQGPGHAPEAVQVVQGVDHVDQHPGFVLVFDPSSESRTGSDGQYIYGPEEISASFWGAHEVYLRYVIL